MADRYPLVLGSDGLRQQIQSTDTFRCDVNFGIGQTPLFPMDITATSTALSGSDTSLRILMYLNIASATSAVIYAGSAVLNTSGLAANATGSMKGLFGQITVAHATYSIAAAQGLQGVLSQSAASSGVVTAGYGVAGNVQANSTVGGYVNTSYGVYGNSQVASGGDPAVNPAYAAGVYGVSQAGAAGTSAKTITTMSGVDGLTQNLGGMTASNMIGVRGQVTQSAASTITVAYGLYAQITGTATVGAAITTANGIYASYATGNSIGTYRGIYLPATGLLATTEFAIYSLSTSDSYFAGWIGLGSTAPVSRLYLGGNISDVSWTTIGKIFAAASATLTDTSTAAAGTVASRYGSSFNAPTLAASNAITVTFGANLRVAPCIKGTNVTLTTCANLHLASGAVSTVTTSWGLYCDVNTGATNNYAAYFGGNVGINNVTPADPLDVTGNISGSAAILSSGASGGVGYKTGAGGTVTQLTSKATGVTLNKTCGAITMNNATLNANTTVSFVLTNTSIAAGDVLVMNHSSGGTIGSYLLEAACAAGSATIYVRNITTGNLSEAIVISFAVIKAVTA